MTLLQIIQAVANELGLTSVTSVVGNQDKLVVQYLALANALGQRIATDYEWQKMNKIHTFTVQTTTQDGNITDGSAVISGLSDTSNIVASTWQVTGAGIQQASYVNSIDSATQVTLNLDATETLTATSLTFTQTAYDLPTDYDFQVNRTQWDRLNHWELVGPKSAQEWEWMLSGIVAAGPRIRYRILNNKFQIWPLVVSASLLAFEYISTSWVYAQGGTEPSKSTFTLDTDSCVFRDRLMIAGIKKMLFEIKGFDSTAFQREYDRELEKAQAQDAGSPTLSLAPRYDNILISPANIQDGYFPS